MDEGSKNKLYIITLILDIFLLYGLFFNKFDVFDSCWMITVLICHMLFYYSLILNNRDILDILHYFVIILPSLSIFSKNVVIKTLSLLLLILIQILWVLEGRCILNEKEYEFGYGDELNYYMILITPILGFNLGYNLTK